MFARNFLDLSAPSSSQKQLNLAQGVYRIYTGAEDQNPDPLIESIEGIGATPAYRGLAYVVIEDFPLGDYGNRIPNFTRDMAEMGRTPSSRVLTIAAVALDEAPEAAAQLKLRRRDKIVRVQRVRLADGQPLSLQTGYFPEKHVGGLIERGLRDDESLTAVLQEEYHISIAVSRQTISATAANQMDAQYLMVTPGDPMLLVERTSYVSTNEPVEFVVDRRVPDFSFKVWLRRR